MAPSDPKKLPTERALARAIPEPANVAAVPAYLPPPWAAAPEAGPAGPPGLSSAPSMGALWQAFRRRWLLILVLGLTVGSLAAAAVWRLLPGQYVTQAVLELRPKNRGGDEGGDMLSFKRAQIVLLKSTPVLQSALARPEVAGLGEVQAHEDAVSWLQKDLKPDDNTEGASILRLNLPGERPEDLPVVLNEVIKEYLREFVRQDRNDAEDRRKRLEASLGDWAEKLRAKRVELAAKEKALRLPDTQAAREQREPAVRRLGDAQLKSQEIKNTLTGAKVELARLNEQIKHSDQLQVSEFDQEAELRQDEGIKESLRDLVRIDKLIQHDKAVAAGGGGPYVEERKTVLAALKERRRDLLPGIKKRLQSKQLDELKKAQQKLAGQVEAYEQQLAEWTRTITKLENLVEKLGGGKGGSGNVPVEVAKLRDEILRIDTVTKKINEELASIAAEYPPAQKEAEDEFPSSPRVKVMALAKVPVSRDTGRQVKMAGMAFAGTFGLVLIGVALLESRKRRVYAADDVAQGLGINLVGTLPALPARSRRALPATGGARDLYWQNVMSESVDVIRTVLLHSARIDALRVVMVTSASGGEGKTSLASHLASSLARAWRKTLLIDCDLRNPAAHQQFDLPLEPGISELLRGEVEPEDVIRPTPVSRLWMIPAGKWDSHAIQALAQDEVRTFFDNLKKEYDFIVIDACPVLPVADSLLIGQHADAVLFSVMRDVSRMPAVYAAHQRLATLGIRMLGAVVIGEKPDTYGGTRYLASTPLA